MARPMSESLTDREAEIMDVLWRRGAATADEIRSLLQGDPHDSTVRTLLRVMEKKGLVSHQVKQRTYVYKAKVARAKARRKAVKGLLDRLFGGSVTSLVLQLLDDEKITREQLAQLADEVKPDSSASKKRGI
jgi:BlaI family penicillinase repressor